MEKIYEHIVTTYNTDFYHNFNSLNEKLSVDEIFGEKYFVSAKSMGTAQHPHFEYDTSRMSSKDEGVFEENYGNPLCSVNHCRRILNIEKTDEKVSIKLFYYERARRVGKPYFVKSTAMYFLTYNYKTNSIYYGSLINYHKKRKCVKKLRRAVLCEDPVNHFQFRINEFFNGAIFSGGNVEFEKFDGSLVIKKFIDAIPTIKEFDVEDKYTLYRHYLTTSGVKLPNNWKCLIETYPQPKKTDYKKVGFKYVEALMSIRGMKGDKLKRTLHRIKSLNMVSYEFAVNLFGLDFLLSRPDDEIELILDNPVYFHEYRGGIEFSKTELKNIYSIYKLVCLKIIDYTSFSDHIYFKPKILKY